MSFPLPLTPFEEYMLRDGTPSHPMEFFYRLSFDGSLDPEALAAAAAAAFRRHPLLAARVASPRGRRPRFEPGPPPRPIPRVVSSAADELPPIPALDIAAGPLAALVVVERPDGSHDILAQFAHVACDGLGALAFLADLCAALDGRPGEPPDAELLRRRGRYGLDAPRLAAMLPSQLRGLEGVWKFLRHRPVALGPAAAPPPPLFPLGRHVIQRASAVFSAAEARSLRRAATAAGVSLNELAAAALFRAVVETVAAPALRPGDVVRASIPMNMRRPADRRMPAANVVSIVFLDRSPAAVESPGLAASLHDEMQLIKRLGLGMTFLFTLAVARWLPGGIGGLVRDRTTAATALFTNLGRIFGRATERGSGRLRAGARQVAAVEPLAPLRRGTPVGVAAVEYAGQLTFTLRTDPAVLDAAATAALRDAFDRRLRDLAAAPPPAPPATHGSAPADLAEACP